mgnify:CR=1 FL=1
MVSVKTVSRLTLYRQLLRQLATSGATHVFSHQLADLARSSAAQVRRDLMVLKAYGNPRTGYLIDELQKNIDDYLAFSQGITTILIGVGSLGRALLAYFMTGRSNIRIVAAFDSDPRKAGRIMSGCRVYLPEELLQQTVGQNIHCALLAVPGSEAQKTADLLVKTEIPSIVNFAPVRIKVPPTVFVEDLDVTSSIEKAAFFGRHMTKTQEMKK